MSVPPAQRLTPRVAPRWVGRGPIWWFVRWWFFLCVGVVERREAVGVSVFLASDNDREKRNQPPPRRAFWGIVRESSPCSSLQGRCPSARRGGVWGRRSRFTTALLSTPAPRGVCEKSPHLWAELPFAPRRGGVGVEVCFAFPNDVPAAFPSAALARALPFPIGGFGDSHRRRWFVPCVSQRRLLGFPTPPPPSWLFPSCL